MQNSATQSIDTWLLSLLACPRHHCELSCDNSQLTCTQGCRYPIVNGIPVLLLSDANQSIDLAHDSLRLADAPSTAEDLFIDSLGVSEHEKMQVRQLAQNSSGAGIDPVASVLVGATNGIAYKNQIGKLQEYPIPQLRLPAGNGAVLLDIGCSWGRWCVAAARKGYRVIGVDPSLGAVMAATRVFRQLGLQGCFIVGDARFLPIRNDAIAQVFSYSVIQHLSRPDAALAIAEAGRVLAAGGRSFVQMPTKAGIRCLYHQVRRGFSDGTGFDVRYWSLPALRQLFARHIGPTTFSIDCFFGIGLQYTDLRFMTPLLKTIVVASEMLRRLGSVLTPLVWVADSVYVSSQKPAASRPDAKTLK